LRAIGELRARLGTAPDASGESGVAVTVDGPDFGLAELPDGITATSPEGWIWAESHEVPTLRDPAAYLIDDDAGGRLHDSPYAMLREGGGDWTAEMETYCRRSADVTMRGGTTSGVVYPAAICEIARRYRLRNVGGASAGAIAAAAAAAAELGRMGAADGTLPEGAERLDTSRRQRGHVRPGFPGLADCLAWLTQADDEGREQYRLAQLFVPTGRMRPLYRFAVAAMRGRLAIAPILMVGAFGLFSKAITLLAVIGTIAAVMLSRPAGADAGAWADLGVALAALTGPTLLAVGAGLAFLRLPGLAPLRIPEQLREPVVPPRTGPTGAFLGRLSSVGWPILSALAGGALVAGAVLWPPLRVDLPTLAWAWTGLVLFSFVVVAASVLRLLHNGKNLGYGLVSGAAAPPDRLNLLDRVAGAPLPTVDRPLLPWLSDTLNELAGLPEGEVLRFGHLWYGHRFTPGTPPEDVTLVADDPRRRRINLELMASELAQRRAYRFPLDRNELLLSQDGGQLYFDPADLHSPGREVLPRAVVDAMIGGAQPVRARDIESADGDPITLYPLPQPWDLPVVFATRLSLALPVLLQAVRLYRAFGETTVRDEFGRILGTSDGPLRYPAPDGQESALPWVQQLWFTDGGVTSNFPIHFFDSLLPLWPTFGINLGDHPPGYAHQDVWLPQDWQGKSSHATPVSGNLLGFLMSVVDTARGWSDNAQTRMPGYRGRVAWVRQRPDEGGENLFMPNAVVAALALRGALAGARLRRRFSVDPLWRRHQWLRQRIAMGNLESLRDTLATSARAPQYQGFATEGGARLDALIASLTEYDPDVPAVRPDEPDPWFRPGDPAYWSAVGSAFDAFGSADGWPTLAQGPPQPAPKLRQAPPT
jgi:hypothetical protein